MMQAAIVSTECPSCGAPLDFSEGSNAVHCQHCQSHLLVTGRTQLLSYQIAPTVDPRDAARTALYECEASGTPARVRDATLWLVPYYRMTGHDLRWEWATQRERRPDDDPEARLWATVLPHAAPLEPLSPDDDLRQLQLHDRYIEKSFLACAVEGVTVPLSLGLRPTVLRLRLFRPDQAGTRYRVIAPTVSAQRAWDMGLKAVGSGEAVYRRVLRRVLSLVYQPVWAVAVKAATEAHVFVDALTGKVIRGGDNAATETVPPAEPMPPVTIAGLRPLVCPNCGWALPLEPDDVIVPCASCWRAYAIQGDELHPVDYRLGVIAQQDGASDAAHVPFWVIDATVEAERLRFHIPAFRYRRLKFLVDLARALSACPPDYSSAPAAQFRGCGAFYDQDDAAALAAFVLSAANPNSDRKAKQLARTPLQVNAANLVWIPYRHERDALIDPFTGRAFSTALLG